MTTTPQPALTRPQPSLTPVPAQPLPEADEDPHSPGLIPYPIQSSAAALGDTQTDDWSELLGLVTGGAIALITLVVPLLSVVNDRGAGSSPPVRNASTLLTPQSDGPSPSPRLSRTGFGEPGGGDSGR